MNDSEFRPGADRDGREPGISQQAFATRRGRVIQSGRDQYIFNVGNALWVTMPALLVAVGMLLYALAHSQPSPSPARSAAKPSSRSANQAAVSSSRHTTPLAVALSYDRNNVDNGAGACVNWMFRRPLSALPAPPGTGATNETWAHQYGGVDQQVTNFKVAVQGLTPTAVELTDFRVIDVKRAPLFKGADVISTDGCGPSTEAGFNLGIGDEPPTVRKASLDRGAAKPIPFPFQVSSTDIQQFQISASYSNKAKLQLQTCNCIIKWRLALDWSYQGRTGVTVIDDNGRPFETMFPRLQPNSSVTPWYDDNGNWKRL